MSNPNHTQQTKKKMDKFLDSFDSNITMHTREDGKKDLTHKSIDYKRGVDAPKQTLTRFSTLTADDLSPESLDIFQRYQRDGYVIVEDFFKGKALKKLQEDMGKILDACTFGENEFYGGNTKRAYALMKKTRSLDDYFVDQRLTQFVAANFAPNPLLSACQGIEIFPGEKAQKLHFDQQFMNNGETTRGEDVIVNCVVAIDEFTEDNGATIVVPGSHLWSADRSPTPNDKPIPVIMKAGSGCFFSGNLWHGGGENRTKLTRRAFIAVFQQPWLRTLENHFLSIPFELAAKLHPQIQAYLGYSLHHPFLGLVDFQHPKKVLMEIAELEGQGKKRPYARL
jgi:ectoine hydroxylase-related dioxygenase (phytanoyl-CoA dioxygenase family)